MEDKSEEEEAIGGREEERETECDEAGGARESIGNRGNVEVEPKEDEEANGSTESMHEAETRE